ncbi:MAG: formate dehydrogenase accessory protein FdhE [Candidatus Eisenbacteria sp.]|nr:formate dehydrogenase accessory protein FdhE [Candidatus Eisenbacteria bacterium]
MSTRPTANALASLDGKEGISPELLALESRLLDWRQSLTGEIRSCYPEPKPDPSILTEVLESGSTLVTVLDPLPQTTLLSKALTQFLAATQSILPAAGDLSRWLARMDCNQGEQKLARWFTASWKGDQGQLEALAVDSGLEVGVLEWTGRQLAKPFFHRWGEIIAGHPAFESRDPLSAGCPACGGPPRMGRYEREEGRRFLWCDLCNLQWVFPRLTCAFCLNRDQVKLGFLTIEGADPYRIDVCEVCRGYLRALDERKLPEDSRVDFLIEDVGTLHLCILAEKEDFRQGSMTGSAPAGPSPVN